MILKYKCCGYERVVIRDFKTKEEKVKCPHCKKYIKEGGEKNESKRK